MEGIFRATHSKLVHHSEEIAFYGGASWERLKVNQDFEKLENHIGLMLEK